jgi:hypothetical protein
VDRASMTKRGATWAWWRGGGRLPIDVEPTDRNRQICSLDALRRLDCSADATIEAFITDVFQANSQAFIPDAATDFASHNPLNYRRAKTSQQERDKS